MLDSLLSARPGSHFRGPVVLGDEDDEMPDKGVNFPMFLTMMGERLFEFDSEAELVEAFECFDENDTGIVKVDEVRKWLKEVGDRMSEEEVSHTTLNTEFNSSGGRLYNVYMICYLQD